MEYQKIINLLDNTPRQPTKFGTKNWIEINSESWVLYNKDNQIRFKTSMLRSSSRDYSGAYTLVKGTITVAQATAAAPNNATKMGVFNSCAPFTICISRKHNTKVDDGQYIDVVMPTYKLIDYSDNYSKTSGVLWEYCRDEPAVDANGAITNFTEDNTITDSFKIKEKITGQTGNNATIKISKYFLENSWNAFN